MSDEFNVVYKKKEIRHRDSQANSYERLYSNYDNNVEITSVMTNLKPRMSELILDAGAGVGRFTKRLLQLGCHVVATDFSSKSLKVLIHKYRECSSDLHVVLADICRLPFKQDIFDKVLSVGVLEHLPSPSARSMVVSEVKRVLKDNSVFVLTVYNYKLGYRIHGDKQGSHAGQIYYFRFTDNELKTLLNLFFKIETIKGIFNLSQLYGFVEKFNMTKFGTALALLDIKLSLLPTSRFLGDFLIACARKTSIKSEELNNRILENCCK